VCVLTVLGLAVPSAWAAVTWKGVDWDLQNATAVINPDDSLTLTLLSGSGSGIGGLHANRLPFGGGTFDSVTTPWVQWAFAGHKGDMLIEQEAFPGPTVQVGSNWGYAWAVTRYTKPDNSRPEEYFLWNADTVPITHSIYLDKRTDGTVDARFDSNPLASSTFLTTNVGGNWGFNDVYLRMRSGTAGDTITFTDFQYGDTSAIPEPSTFIVWSVLGASAIGLGWWRKRKAA